jgi:hypothetical protein
MEHSPRRRKLPCLLAMAILAGCASAAKHDVQFTPAFSVPAAGAGERAANVIVSTETPDQLVAQGFVRIGTLDIASQRDPTGSLIQAARKFGADALSLHQDNRPRNTGGTQTCVDIKNPGTPTYCKKWNMETGVCNHWSAPTDFECRRWETAQGAVPQAFSRAMLWRREPLAAAITRGESAVREALDAGANPNAGWAPLYYAIERPDAGALRALLAGGARADSGALGYAARTGKIDAAQALIAAGAPVREPYVRRAPLPVQGTTPLHEAVRSGDPEVAALLIARGADVNAIPAFGSTALTTAVLSDNADMVRLLVDHGANPGLKNLDGVSAADEAAKIPEPGRTRMLQILATALSGRTN